MVFQKIAQLHSFVEQSSRHILYDPQKMGDRRSHLHNELFFLEVRYLDQLIVVFLNDDVLHVSRMG